MWHKLSNQTYIIQHQLMIKLGQDVIKVYQPSHKITICNVIFTKNRWERGWLLQPKFNSNSARFKRVVLIWIQEKRGTGEKRTKKKGQRKKGAHSFWKRGKMAQFFVQLWMKHYWYKSTFNYFYATNMKLCRNITDTNQLLFEKHLSK